MAKEARPATTHTKEARPVTGSRKSVSGFGRGAFGFARFGTSTGYEQDKEALPANTHTKEALSATKIT